MRDFDDFEDFGDVETSKCVNRFDGTYRWEYFYRFKRGDICNYCGTIFGYDAETCVVGRRPLFRRNVSALLDAIEKTKRACQTTARSVSRPRCGRLPSEAYATEFDERSFFNGAILSPFLAASFSSAIVSALVALTPLDLSVRLFCRSLAASKRRRRVGFFARSPRYGPTISRRVRRPLLAFSTGAWQFWASSAARSFFWAAGFSPFTISTGIRRRRSKNFRGDIIGFKPSTARRRRARFLSSTRRERSSRSRRRRRFGASALRRESRAKARTALATLLAGAAFLLISTAFVGERFKAVDALKRYKSSTSVLLDLGVRGESIFGYWRVESQNLRAYLVDGGEEVAVRVVPIGAKTFGWGPFIIERRSDITESATEAFRVVAEVRLPENRALAGRELRLKGEVELEFPTELEEEWRSAVVDNFIDVKKTAKVDVPFKLPKDFANRAARNERAEATEKYVVVWRCGFVAAFLALTTAVASIGVETRRAEKDAEKKRSAVVSVAPETKRARWEK